MKQSDKEAAAVLRGMVRLIALSTARGNGKSVLQWRMVDALAKGATALEERGRGVGA